MHSKIPIAAQSHEPGDARRRKISELKFEGRKELAESTKTKT
jgi:hypothetical protein